MFFEQSKIPNPVQIPFNWVADYADGTYLSEYNFSSNVPNSFYSIKQNEVVKFGLFGQQMKMFFDTYTGKFSLNRRRMDVVYEVDGKSYVLTNNSDEKDLITYKQAYSDFNKKNGKQKSNIESISFGYKTNYKKDEMNLFFQPIVTLPFNNSAYIEVKLTSDVDVDGYLVFVSRGKEVERFHAPLKAGVSGQLNWTIK